MRRILSKQRNVVFVFCASPITIDKRGDWGDYADNLQIASDGAFLKMKSPTEVSHLVQPNADKTAPIGWVAGDGPGLFSKLPIWVTDEIIPANTDVKINTLDGELNYRYTTPSMVTYNGDENGPNLNDGWLTTIKDLQKNYEYEPAAATA
jgi:hypothetical protein